MPTTTGRYTVEEVLAFPPDGNRYELVGGELLVTPAPSQRHQIVLDEVYFRLREYLGGCRTLARSFFSPADIAPEARELEVSLADVFGALPTGG